MSLRPAIVPLAVLAIALAGGCASYSAQPLQPIKRAAAPASIEPSVYIAAADLHQARLPAVKIDPILGLSPEDAAVVAVLIHPELRADRDQHAEAAAQLMQAGLLPNPQVSGTLDFPQGADRADSYTAFGLGFDYEFTALISRNAKVQAATASADSIDLTIAWKEWQIAAAAKLAAYDAQAIDEQVKIAREEDNALADNLKALQAAYDRKDKTIVDLSAAMSSAADAHAIYLAAAKDQQHARSMLNRALGVGPDAKVKLRAGPLANHLPAAPPADLARDLSQSRLDLAALQRGYDSQEAMLRAAVLSQFPKISCGLNGARDTSAIKTIGLGVNIELPLFDHNQAAIAQETATRQRLYDEYAQRLFEAQSDVATAIADLRAIADQIAGDEAALPALEQASTAFRAASDRGDADVFSAYAARSALLQKRLDVAKLKQDQIDTWIALELACGRLLPTTQPVAAVSMIANQGATQR